MVNNNLSYSDISVKVAKFIRDMRSFPTPMQMQMAAGNDPYQLVRNRDAQKLAIEFERAESIREINFVIRTYNSRFFQREVECLEQIKHEVATHSEWGIYYRRAIANRALYDMNTGLSRSLIDYNIQLFPPVEFHSIILVIDTHPIATITGIIYRMLSDKIFRMYLGNLYYIYKNNILSILFIFTCLIVSVFSLYLCWVLL